MASAEPNGRIPMISTGLPVSLRRPHARPPRDTGPRIPARSPQRAPPGKPPLLSLDQQLALLREQAPKGFADPAWIEAHRDPAKGPARKRHVAAASVRARDVLSPTALGALTATQRLRTVSALLKKTSLVPLAEAKALAGCKPVEPLAQALLDLVSAPTDGAIFGRWITAAEAALGRAPSWELATALPALLSPTTRVCVCEQLEAQALLVAPGAKIGPVPTVDGYDAANRIADATRAALRQAGEKPADLLDVRAFVQATLGST